MKLSHSKKEDFSILFDKHYGRLFNYCFKIVEQKSVSDELVHETFIRLWENMEKVSNNERSIESFLIVTLKNKIVDYHRKNVTRKKHTNSYLLDKDFEQEIENEWELLQQIDTVYNSLNPKTAEIFRLSRDKGLTYKEIASSIHVSVKTVELHISKALHAFKKGLEDYL